MDYVVFGIGFGATILVLGLLLRDFGPRLRFRRARDGGDVLGAEELVAKVSWTRFCTALGSVLALAGAAFLLITLVAMILVVSDNTGLWIMSSAYGLLLVLMAYWTWAYFHRFGSYGILPERVEPEPVFSDRRRAQDSDDDLDEAATDEDEHDDESDKLDDEYIGEPGHLEDEDIEASGDETGDFEEDLDRIASSGEASDDHEDTEAGGEAPDSEQRLQTPEERLAHAESPIDHGSAEGDLDLAASAPRRPGPFTSRPVTENHDQADTAEAEDEPADADERRADA